ncbi:MAG: L-lysine 6-transaminase [Candidatus Neomarinimicrobiota bacterium]
MKINFNNSRELIGHHMLADGMSPVIDLEKSHGSWLVDGNTGKEYLDLFSMFASMSIGYNHPYVIDQKERLLKAAINKPTNSDIYSPEMANFVHTFGEIAQPNYLPYSFFIEGGALAVENALKAAFDWKVKLNLSKGKPKGGNQIIHFKDCFHGRSGYTMSLTDSPDPRKVQYFPKFNWPKVSNPYMSFPMNSSNYEKVTKLEQKSISEIKNILIKSSDDIAGLIIEPIQGEGGDNHFRKEFLIQLKELSLENDFLLIFDEVQTGIGITGKMWSHQRFIDVKTRKLDKNLFPDLMSFGKKTQVCGILGGERLNEIENNVFKESSRINSTFGGNLVDMVRFTIYLEVIEREKLLDKAYINGKYLLSLLEKLESEFIEIVSNSRGKGLWCAFDLPNSKTRDHLINLIQKEGALILGSGHNSIRFRPHLNISKNEIDIAIEIISKALKKL